MLGPLAAQSITNLLADRHGKLRGNIQLTDLGFTGTPGTFSPTLPAGVIDGVGFLAPFPITYTAVGSPTTPAAGRLLVVNGGKLSTYPFDSPLTYPPTFGAGNVSAAVFITGKRVRFVQYGSEVVGTQESNAFRNYLIGPNGSLNPLGVSTPITAITISSVAVGSSNKNGIYKYLVTVADSAGRESSPGTSVTSTTYTSGGVLQPRITIPAGLFTDPQVATVYLYEQVPGSSTYNRITSFVAAGFYDDNLTDTAVLTGVFAPNFGENNPPAPASLAAVWKNHLVLDRVDTQGVVQISNSNSITQFANLGITTNPNDGINLTLSASQADKITGFVPLGSPLVVFTRNKAYVILGDDQSDFQTREVNADRGCIAPDSAVRCDNDIIFLSKDGVYKMSGSFEAEKISKPLENIILTLSATPTGFVLLQNAFAVYANRTYYLTISDTTYCFNLDTGGWTTIKIGTEVLNCGMVANTAGGPPLPIFGRSDLVKVSLLDTLTASITVAGMRYRTRPMQTDIPQRLRSNVGEQEVRTGRKRIHRVWVYGSGTISSGTIKVNSDTRTPESYSISTPSPQLLVDGVLIAQEFTGNMTGRLLDVELNFAGTGIIVTDVQIDFIFVG